MALGNFLAAVNRPEEAEKNFLKGIELSPKEASLRIHLGNFYLAWNKKDKAEASFKEAVEKDSKNISRPVEAGRFLHHRKKI